MKKAVFSAFLLFGSLAAGLAQTPQSVVDAFEEMYASITDYQCRMWEYCRQGSRYEERNIDFYFKRPRLIRMDILKGNRTGDGGSVGVYKNDRVTGRKGGILGIFAITVNKHDTQATTIRGVTFDQSDMQATLEKMRFHLANSACALSVSEDVYVLVFEPYDPAASGGVTKDVIRLDVKTLLPVSSDSFEGTRNVQHAGWERYILNAGLPDELFDVHWDTGRLSKMDIPTVHGVPLK